MPEDEQPRRSRLAVGVDVPWVTSWSDEAVVGVGPCHTVDGDLAVRQQERPGFGRPQYSKNHYRRQRASVRAMLCPMCGAPAPQGDRWSVTGRLMAAGALRAEGLGFALPGEIGDERVVLNAGAISPGHLRCLQRSLELCPHLAADPSRAPLPFPARFYISPLMELPRAAPAAAYLARPADLLSAVGFLQLCGITDSVDPAWSRRGGLGRRRRAMAGRRLSPRGLWP